MAVLQRRHQRVEKSLGLIFVVKALKKDAQIKRAIASWHAVGAIDHARPIIDLFGFFFGNPFFMLAYDLSLIVDLFLVRLVPAALRALMLR